MFEERKNGLSRSHVVPHGHDNMGVHIRINVVRPILEEIWRGKGICTMILAFHIEGQGHTLFLMVTYVGVDVKSNKYFGRFGDSSVFA